MFICKGEIAGESTVSNAFCTYKAYFYCQNMGIFLCLVIVVEGFGSFATVGCNDL